MFSTPIAAGANNGRPCEKSSEIRHLAGLQLQLELVCNQGNKLTVGRLTFRITDRVPEKSLQGIQVASVPGYFDGVSDGTLYSGRRGIEGLGHLRVQHLGDGVDHIHIVDRDDDGFPQVLIALDMGRDADGFIAQFMALMLSCLFS